MAMLKDLLARDDIKGGEIQVVFNSGRNKGRVHRSPITEIQVSEQTVYFKPNKTWIESHSVEKTEWKESQTIEHHYPAETALLGGNGRPQFEIVDSKGQVVGWAIIFPKGDRAIAGLK